MKMFHILSVASCRKSSTYKYILKQWNNVNDSTMLTSWVEEQGVISILWVTQFDALYPQVLHLHYSCSLTVTVCLLTVHWVAELYFHVPDLVTGTAGWNGLGREIYLSLSGKAALRKRSKEFLSQATLLCWKAQLCNHF